MNDSTNELDARLRRIVAAERSGDAEALNDALISFGRLLESFFQAKIERGLSTFREVSGGYNVTVDDACDVLNELLWIVCRRAKGYRGRTDAEAYAWLNRTVENHLIDKGRTISRRAKKWREFFPLIPKRLKALLRTNDGDEL